MPGPQIDLLFPTLVYRAENAGPGKLNRALARIARDLALSDAAGRRWCARHGYSGYTSYGSMPDLGQRYAAFRELERVAVRHARAFMQALCWDARGAKPYVDSIWVNLLPPRGSHTSHLHTNAVLSGTYYVDTSNATGPLVFEDPRHALMMAAPPRKSSAPRELQTYVSEHPKDGTLILWESWLRHEVAMNQGSSDRISVSFNCVLR